MLILAKLFGILIAVFGLTVCALPQVMQKLFDFMKEGKRIYGAGVLRCLIGLVLLLASPQSAIPITAIAMGVVFLLSGIIVFACDLEKLKGVLAHYGEMPVLILRLLGLLVAAFGILVFSVV